MSDTLDANKMMGIEPVSDAKGPTMVSRARDHVMIDVSSADKSVGDVSGDLPSFQNCRAFSVDVSGIIKFDIRDGVGGSDHTVIMQPAAGVLHPVGHISKVYANYKTGTACTATCYDATGTLKAGLHLWR